MYWFAIVLLALGALILGFTNPWKFFQAARGSFFDWTDLFWPLQWSGFWLIAASLALFGRLACRVPSTFTTHWKLIPPAIALALFVLFFFYSMPEKSNQADWRNGWLGARVYWRTKLWFRGDDGGEAALSGRLVGRWEVPGGLSFTISRDAVRMTTPFGETEWSVRTCPYRFRMEYDFAYRSALTQPLLSRGLEFRPLEFQAGETNIPLPDRRFPRLYCSCDSKATTWVLVDIDRLIVSPDEDSTVIARRR
jgi:hypothetical protein